MMKKFSAKNKIFFLLTLWIALLAIVFMYLFGILDASNNILLNRITKQKKDLSSLQAEKASYKQAQADLQKLAEKSLQPSGFFSKDITLVKEIQTLEGLNQALGVKMQLSGISGTVNSASKAKTVTPIGVVPYAISISGDLATVTDFVEILENLNFITNVTNISLASGENGTVNASLSANFYIKK
jgi:Tfp pilus assembly protein PilO